MKQKTGDETERQRGMGNETERHGRQRPMALGKVLRRRSMRGTTCIDATPAREALLLLSVSRRMNPWLQKAC